MCGIAGGIWTNPKKAIPADVLQRMTNVLAHRGPDDEGTYASEFLVRPPYEPVPGVALGARRLSIIDIAGGHQPIANEDKSIWVVLNGEIYNHRDLRFRLEGAGHRFRTQCDTEVLVHLYEDEGVAFTRHLDGMFAIAIWDSRQRQLVLARDRLGQKPLVYRKESDRLLFSSELKAILQVPDVAREIDPNAIDEFLTYQYIPHPNTIFKGMRKLPPAHYAVFRDGKLEVQRYWQPQWQREIADSPVDYAHTLSDALSGAVEQRMQSEVPLGAFLSGGIDSSIIVALMQKLSVDRIKTFSIGFPEPEYDESAEARKVAEHLDTDHHEFRVTPNAVSILPEIIKTFDEPFADSSALPTWYLAEQTRQVVTVALSGDGGDELFAGYPRYRAVRLGAFADRLPSALKRAMGSAWFQSLPGNRRKSWPRRLKRFTSPLGLSPARRYLEWIAIFDEASRANLYSEDFLGSLGDADPFLFLNTAWQSTKGRDAISQAAFADLQTYLPCDLMTKVDIATMAHSLECRQPFLDHHVVELAVRMPINLKFRRGKGKQILSKAFGHLLPRSVFARAKMGFGVPLDHWFRNELKDYVADIVLDPRALGRGYFRPEAVAQLVEQHCQAEADHADKLWALMILELWHREWIDAVG